MSLFFRFSADFIPIVLAIAIGSSLYWLIAPHEPISFAITVFATVLVVSCPCALGIDYSNGDSLGNRQGCEKGY